MKDSVSTSSYQAQELDDIQHLVGQYPTFTEADYLRCITEQRPLNPPSILGESRDHEDIVQGLLSQANAKNALIKCQEQEIEALKEQLHEQKVISRFLARDNKEIKEENQDQQRKIQALQATTRELNETIEQGTGCISQYTQIIYENHAAIEELHSFIHSERVRNTELKKQIEYLNNMIEQKRIERGNELFLQQAQEKSYQETIAINSRLYCELYSLHIELKQQYEKLLIKQSAYSAPDQNYRKMENPRLSRQTMPYPTVLTLARMTSESQKIEKGTEKKPDNPWANDFISIEDTTLKPKNM